MTLANRTLENIAAAASRVLVANGKSAASMYIFQALEDAGLYFHGFPKKSKLKAWEVYAVADRSLALAKEVH